MKIQSKHPLTLVCCLLSIVCFSQTNLSVLGHVTFNGTTSNLTGYADSSGREYALVGTWQGMEIVAIDTPANPRKLFLVPGAIGQDGFWREVREYKGYAYVTTEESSGLVVVNLNYLPDSVQYHTINPGGMTKSHTVFIDSNGIAYINGTDKGLLILDLNADAYNPPLIGKFTNNYVHDCFVRNDTMWAACINDGIIKVVDVRNKAAADDPANTITSWATPLNFSHNCWLSDDSKYLFTTDEKPNSPLTCYDVSDLNNVTETNKTISDAGSNTIIHNTYFLNNYCVTSYYTYGITIHDVTRKNNLVEVGHFDSSPNYSGDGSHGAWGVWPYLPSGNIIVSDIETGLWILKPDYKRACYLEGVVRDNICNTSLTDVKIEIVEDSVSDFTDFLGKYSMGTPDSGTYTIRFSKNGYQTREYQGVNLRNGFLTTIDVNLVPVSTSKLVIKTVDADNRNDLPFIRVLIQDTNNTTYLEITSDANGVYNICNFIQGPYNFYAGRWGRITAKVSDTISNLNDTLIIPIAKGYYDDFIMDYGWTSVTTASSGDWQRGEPDRTTYQGTIVNPGDDIVNDFGADCFVTGNNGGSAGNDDIDDGYTLLRSPLFDLSTYADPYISYYRWFYDDGGNGTDPNDSLKVFLSNGFDSVLVDEMNADSVQSRWRYKNFRVKDFVTLTPNMRILLKAEDSPEGHLVEAALDVFKVVDSGSVLTNLRLQEDDLFRIYPNPASNHFIMEKQNDSPSSLVLCDVTGRMLLQQTITEKFTRISISELGKGIYIARLFERGQLAGEKKLVKVE